MTTYPYAARFPDELRPELESAAAETGQSINQLIVACVGKSLHEVRAEFSRRRVRLTNVDPLPESVLEAIYAGPERDEAGTDRLAAAQAKGVRD